MGAHSNIRRALALWLVTTLPWPSGGPSCPLTGTGSLRFGDEYRTERLVRPSALGLEPARPLPTSARRDFDVDDCAILDDGGADEEGALSDGAKLAGAIPTAGSSPLSPHLSSMLAGATGRHAKRLPVLCRYRC